MEVSISKNNKKVAARVDYSAVRNSGYIGEIIEELSECPINNIDVYEVKIKNKLSSYLIEEMTSNIPGNNTELISILHGIVSEFPVKSYIEDLLSDTDENFKSIVLSDPFCRNLIRMISDINNRARCELRCSFDESVNNNRVLVAVNESLSIKF